MVLFFSTSTLFGALQYLTKSIETQTAFESVSINFQEDTHTSSAIYDDAIDENVPIGFSFPFNGTTYSTVNIDSNGHLAFVDITSEYSNQELPRNNREQSIYPYWDDLNVDKGGTIKYGTLGVGDTEHFVVSWENVPHYPSNGSYSFQVILYKTGDIRFRYNSTSSVNGDSATIGVQENSSNYDQHSFDDVNSFDATKDILYEIPIKLAGVTPTCTTPVSQLNMTTYNTTGYNNYPSNETTYETFIQNYAVGANLFGTGLISQINGSGNPYGSDDNYLSIFEGYIYLPTRGFYSFGIDGDDAVEVYIDDTLITGWYGGHGRAGQAKYIVNLYATSGWHKVEYHHQERGGGDNYYLYWKKPSGSLEIVPSTQFFNCGGAQMSVSKSSCVLSDLINGTNNPKRIPGATIRYAIEVKNEGSSSASDVKVSDSLGAEFDEVSIVNLQVQSGECDCLGVTSASNNGVNGTADGVNPIILDFGDVLGGSVASPTIECGYFEAVLK